MYIVTEEHFRETNDMENCLEFCNILKENPAQ